MSDSNLPESRPNGKEKSYEDHAYQWPITCPACKEAELTEAGEIEGSEPPQRWLMCPKCGYQGRGLVPPTI